MITTNVKLSGQNKKYIKIFKKRPNENMCLYDLIDNPKICEIKCL